MKENYAINLFYLHVESSIAVTDVFSMLDIGEDGLNCW